MRGRSFWVISLYILFCSLFPIYSEDRVKPLSLPPSQPAFIPTTYFVGDRVTLRFTLDVSIQEELRPPRSIPALTWGVLHQIQLLPLGGKKGYEVTIMFTPYRTGRQLLPPLELGPFRLDQIPVQVSSLLETTREVPQPVREQVMIPYLNFFLILPAGLLLTIASIYLLWKRGSHSVLFRIWKRHRGKYLYRQLQRKLDRLERGITTMDPNTFYSSLQENLRYYLSHRWTPKIVAYTTTEIELYLEKIYGEGKEEKNNTGFILLEVFRRGDEVKFAGIRVDAQVLRSDLRMIRQVLEEVERTFWEQRRKVKG